VVGGKTEDLKEGIAIAAEVIDSGRAFEKVVRLVKVTGGDLEKLRSWEANL
jgi:anthranilate phosphoribosyltransferase